VDLISWLGRHDLTLQVTPDHPAQTLGAAVSTGSPARLADHIIGLRLVHADGHRTSYSMERDRSLFEAMSVSLGAMGVITQIELRCDERRPGALQRGPVSFGEALSVLEAGDAIRAQRAIIWFANAPALVEYWDDQATPGLKAQLYQQARGVLHDALGTQLLNGLAASLPAGPRWSDTLGAELMGMSSGELLPVGRIRTTPQVMYSIPARQAAEFLLQLRDLWRSLRFPVYAPVRIEFAAASGAWLSPAHGRDSALVSFPVSDITSAAFVDAICALLERCGGRPCWAHLRAGAPPPTAEHYPRLADFGALRRKIDRRGVLLNRYLSSLFGLSDR
jgi:L-gulonolactone oxidase